MNTTSKQSLRPALLLVGLPGFEPGTSASRTQRANQAAPQPAGSQEFPETLGMKLYQRLGQPQRALWLLSSSPSSSADSERTRTSSILRFSMVWIRNDHALKVISSPSSGMRPKASSR